MVNNVQRSCPVNGKIRLDRDQKEGLWDAFFQEYHYYDKITELSSHYPEQRSLFISYEDIDEFDVDFATYVLQNSEEAIEIAISRVRKFISNSGWNYLIKDSNSIIINIRLYNLPEHLGIDIRNIRSMNVGKLLSITGIIRKIQKLFQDFTTQHFNVLCVDQELLYCKTGESLRNLKGAPMRNATERNQRRGFH